MSNLQIFNFKENAVRTLLVNDEVMFVAKDVADCLGYADSAQAIRDNCKRAINLTNGVETFVNEIKELMRTKSLVIPESDVYRLVMRSKLESAESFQDWVVEEVLPSIRKTGSYSATAQPVKQSLSQLNKDAKALASLAKIFGLSGNQALLSVDSALKKINSVSPIALLGIELIASAKEKLLTATEIGKQLDLSAVKTNLLLEDKGFQKSYIDTKNNKAWELTDKGKPFAELLDTGKKHGDGTPVQQIKWRSDVVDVLIA
jgi:prophage antirepressor-like protein